MDIHAVMKSLSQKRSIFHSEADFQFALAWELKCVYPECDIRLEAPFNLADHGKKGRIDIVVRIKDAVYPIELKYLKKSLHHELCGEQFALSEGVHDMDMYDCICDIARLESFCDQLPGFHMGYAVWLTNDRAYWENGYDASYYSEFHAPHGSVKTGKMSFAQLNKRTGRPPQIRGEKNYKDQIDLKGSYRIEWSEYSNLDDTTVRNGLFKYAIISVPFFV
ncbi:MAG: hypothetical protein FWD39_03225 [Clostridiales bacterium]|nr:hypothetical protein [Clostridiales bacterium]